MLICVLIALHKTGIYCLTGLVACVGGVCDCLRVNAEGEEEDGMHGPGFGAARMDVVRDGTAGRAGRNVVVRPHWMVVVDAGGRGPPGLLGVMFSIP